MTDQEKQLIEALAARIQNSTPPQVDRDADDLIRSRIGVRPDALYILTQTVLIQEMALIQAKTQIDDLKQRASQPVTQPGTGFLGSNYQRDYTPAPPPVPPQYAQQQYAQQQYEPAPPPARSGFSGFLHNAATTAAGVVAGEMAFSTLSSIFGNHGGGFFGGGGGGGGFFGGGGGISPGSETIVNNYYEGDRDRDRDRGDGGLSPDLEDRRLASDTDNSATNDNSDDDTSADSADDSSSGDDSSYDDGSGSSDT